MPKAVPPERPPVKRLRLGLKRKKDRKRGRAQRRAPFRSLLGELSDSRFLGASRVPSTVRRGSSTRRAYPYPRAGPTPVDILGGLTAQQQDAVVRHVSRPAAIHARVTGDAASPVTPTNRQNISSLLPILLFGLHG